MTSLTFKQMSKVDVYPFWFKLTIFTFPQWAELQISFTLCIPFTWCIDFSLPSPLPRTGYNYYCDFDYGHYHNSCCWSCSCCSWVLGAGPTAFHALCLCQARLAWIWGKVWGPLSPNCLPHASWHCFFAKAVIHKLCMWFHVVSMNLRLL